MPAVAMQKRMHEVAEHWGLMVGILKLVEVPPERVQRGWDGTSARRSAGWHPPAEPAGRSWPAVDIGPRWVPPHFSHHAGWRLSVHSWVGFWPLHAWEHPP